MGYEYNFKKIESYFKCPGETQITGYLVMNVLASENYFMNWKSTPNLYDTLSFGFCFFKYVFVFCGLFDQLKTIFFLFEYLIFKYFFFSP